MRPSEQTVQWQVEVWVVTVEQSLLFVHVCYYLRTITTILKCISNVLDMLNVINYMLFIIYLVSFLNNTFVWTNYYLVCI